MLSDMLASSLPIVAPELIMAVGAMLLLMYGVFAGERSAQTVTGLSVALIIIAGLWLVLVTPQGIAFGGSFILDPFAVFMKVLVLIGAAAAVVMSVGFAERERFNRFEFPVLIVLSTTGMMMMVSAGDMIGLYLGLELQSLAIYVLAAINRDSVRSTEAGLKYFVLGALSSGMLLYGASLIYGFTGQIEFTAIAASVADGERSLGVLVGLVFVLAGLAFKISAVPFHMWTPDVYEGSPTPVTAFFATAPKVAAMALIARLVHDAFGGVPDQWGQVIAALSVASMFLGAVAAIGQRDIKRLMAYSSIAHMGFALMGLAVGTAGGVQAMLIYMAIYVTMNVGSFAFILSLERDGRPVSDIASLNSFAKKEPLRALAMLVLLFSLAGVPPMLGFIGKFYVATAGISSALWWLVIALMIASTIGLVYYLRLAAAMYMQPAAAHVGRRATFSFYSAAGVALVALAVLLVVLGVYPAPLISILQAMVAGLV